MPNINESVRTGAALAPDPFAGILKGLEDIRKKKEAVDFEMEKGAINLKYFLQELQAKTAAEKDVESFKIDKKREAAGANAQSLLSVAGLKGSPGIDTGEFVPSDLGDIKDYLDIKIKKEQLGLSPEDSMRKGTAAGIEAGSQKTAETAAGAQRALGPTDLFIRGLEKSQQELEKDIPGVGDKGVFGILKRTKGAAGVVLDQYPETSAFLKNKLALANGMAREIEGGRVTDQDREVYAKTLADAISNPSGENVVLVSNALLGLAVKGGDISKTLDKFSGSKTKLLKDVVKRTKEEMNVLGIGKKEDFSSMSDEELKKILEE